MVTVHGDKCTPVIAEVKAKYYVYIKCRLDYMGIIRNVRTLSIMKEPCHPIYDYRMYSLDLHLSCELRLRGWKQCLSSLVQG